MPINKTIKRDSDKQFSAFASIKSIIEFAEMYAEDSIDRKEMIKDISIYKCKLSGNLKTGKWSWNNAIIEDSNSTTLTGDTLTVLENVTDVVLPKLLKRLANVSNIK